MGEEEKGKRSLEMVLGLRSVSSLLSCCPALQCESFFTNVSFGLTYKAEPDRAADTL